MVLLAQGLYWLAHPVDIKRHPRYYGMLAVAKRLLYRRKQSKTVSRGSSMGC